MVDMDVNDEFNLLAASIQRCAAGMSRWGMEELTLGLYKLFRRHELESAIDTISGPQVQDIEELEEMCYWFKWAMVAYQMDRSSIAESLQINKEQIKKHVRTSAVLRPSYYIAVDNVKCCLVMAIRGTQSPTDIMTDLKPHSEKFGKGYAHSGMLGAAKWLMEEEHENLQILLKAYPDDLISRLSPAALEDLHLEISKINWVHILGANSKMKKIVELAQTMHGSLDGIEASLGYENGHFYQQIKSYSYSSLAAAKEMIRTRSTEYQQHTNSSTTQTSFDWLSYGASTIIQYMFTTSSINRSQTQTRDAAIIVENAAAIPTTEPSIDDVPLYIPGVLYHIIHKDGSIPVQHIPPSNGLLRSNTNLEEFKEVAVANKDVGTSSNSPSIAGHYHNQNESNCTNALPLKCVVIKGDDPACRFRRIILSNSMLLDHRCQSYHSALKGAVDCARNTTKSRGNVST